MKMEAFPCNNTVLYQPGTVYQFSENNWRDPGGGIDFAAFGGGVMPEDSGPRARPRAKDLNLLKDTKSKIILS